MNPLTPRQERFCQSFVLNPTAANAAREAGYAWKTAKHQGCRLLRQAAIAARIQAIQWELADAYGRDIGTLIGKLESVYRRALADGRYHAATHAVALQARLGNPSNPVVGLWARLARAAGEDSMAARMAARAAAESYPPAPASGPEQATADAVDGAAPGPEKPGLRAVGG